jgi:hypothetical protein
VSSALIDCKRDHLEWKVDQDIFGNVDGWLQTSSLCYELNRQAQSFVVQIVNLQMIFLAVRNHFASIAHEITTQVNFADL